MSTQDNILAPGAGNDVVTGGSTARTDDTYDVSDATEGVTVDLNDGTSTGGSGTDTFSDIEDVVRRTGADTSPGERASATTLEAAGNDTLAGGAGDDDGDDTFDGGAGIDTVDYSANTLATNVDLNRRCACNGVAGEADAS